MTKYFFSLFLVIYVRPSANHSGINNWSRQWSFLTKILKDGFEFRCCQCKCEGLLEEPYIISQFHNSPPFAAMFATDHFIEHSNGRDAEAQEELSVNYKGKLFHILSFGKIQLALAVFNLYQFHCTNSLHCALGTTMEGEWDMR